MKLDIVNITKFFLLTYIVLSPFIDYTKLTCLNHVCFKIVILLIIIGVSFKDMLLSILLMIAFLLLLVNFNKVIIRKIRKPDLVQDENYVYGGVFEEVKPEPVVKQLPPPLDTYHIMDSLTSYTYPHERFTQTTQEYINDLAPKESLENIQSNLV